MLFMLCVTAVVSLQMQWCSPLAIQVLFYKETNAGSSGRVIWRGKQLVLAAISYKPESNISVLTHC